MVPVILCVCLHYALCVQRRLSNKADVQTLVITRTHEPKPGMVERMQQWSDDFAGMADSGYHYLVSVDTSGNPDETWNVNFTTDSVHRYNVEELQATFRAGAGVPEWGPYKYHMEPIILAVNFARTQVALSRDAKVWVFEDDVYVCGSLINILTHYQGVHADFVCSGRVAKGWPVFIATDFASQSFKDTYPYEKVCACEEHVQMFSVSFIDRMLDLTRQGFTGESEMFAPTVCSHDNETCALGVFDPKDIGRYDWTYRDTEDDAKRWCDHGGDTLNHAGKYESRHDQDPDNMKQPYGEAGTLGCRWPQPF